tara:strand:- start:2361 stop:2669 length:309 start_codon:yes stop_codon:yes gene_type:complete
MTNKQKRQRYKVNRRSKRPYITPPTQYTIPAHLVTEEGLEKATGRTICLGIPDNYSFCNSNVDDFFTNNPNVDSFDIMSNDRILETYINPNKISPINSLKLC